MSERTTDRTRDADDGTRSAVDDRPGAERGDTSHGVDATLQNLDRGVGEFEPGVSRSDRRSSETATASTSRLGGLRRRAGRVFSTKPFAVQLVAALAGVFVVGDLVPVLPLAGFLGLFLTTALVGVLSDQPRFVEAATAGGASGALALFLGSMSLSVFTGGLLPAVGAAVGASLALAGHYVGRDVRDGLTRDL